MRSLLAGWCLLFFVRWNLSDLILWDLAMIQMHLIVLLGHGNNVSVAAGDGLSSWIAAFHGRWKRSGLRRDR